MSLYDKPVWQLMHDMVEELGMEPDDILTKDQVLTWFKDNYRLVKKGTIDAHMLRMSTNAPSRVHFHGKPGNDDLFFQLDGHQYRLYIPELDPPPIYEAPIRSEPPAGKEEPEANAAEFAYEKDLQNFLAKNLSILESGLVLYEEEGINGIEFPAGGRFIDILALDGQQNFVVIELKVSRGYDRTLGQLQRYRGWVKENLADSGQKVRGFIVAREISEDLFLACLDLPEVGLFEYELSVSVKRASRKENQAYNASSYQ